MGQYGIAAINTTKKCHDDPTLLAKDAWLYAISNLTNSPNSIKKSCPRKAYLGLCAAGLVSGIKPYFDTNDLPDPNKTYALKAYELIKKVFVFKKINQTEKSSELRLWGVCLIIHKWMSLCHYGRPIC